MIIYMIRITKCDDFELWIELWHSVLSGQFIHFFFLMSHEWNQHFNYSFIIEWGFQDILSFSNNFRFYNQKKMASKGFNSKVTIHANTPCSFVSSGQRSNLIIICNLWYQVALYHIIIFKYIILWPRFLVYFITPAETDSYI